MKLLKLLFAGAVLSVMSSLALAAVNPLSVHVLNLQDGLPSPNVQVTLEKNNGNDWDESWNPIWFAKTHINKEGWTAEVKIPLSQLRYGNEKEKVWGFQVMRRIFRKEERSTFQLIPQNSGVWVSAFAELQWAIRIRRVYGAFMTEISHLVAAIATVPFEIDPRSS